MPAYRLLPPGGTCTFSKILKGKHWVGRVVKHGDGGYLGIINTGGSQRVEFRAATELAAFEGVVSRRLGYNNVGELRQHNREVRRANRVRNAVVRDKVNRFVRGDLKEKIAVIDEIFDALEGRNGSK